MNEIAVLQRSAPEAPPMSETARLRARRRLLKRALEPSPAQRRRRRFKRVIAAGSVAAALAVSAVALSLGGQSGKPLAPVQSPEFRNAAQVLHAAGTAAAAQEVDVAKAKYWRVDSEYQQSGNGVYRRTYWQGRTSTGFLFDEGFGRGEVVSEMGKAKFGLQQRTLTWDQLLNLTRSPSELMELLREDTGSLKGGTADHYAFKTLGELLGETPAPPALRKAMWDAAADLKGISYDGEIKDDRGRTGYGVTLDQLTYVVEPSTGRILESRLKTKDGGSYRITYLSQGPTDAAPTMPTSSAP